jgi:hypothetical protein
MDGVTELISIDKDKLERILNDCIEKFQLVKYLQERSSFEVNTTSASQEVLDTLNSKLEFVRNNVKKKRK